MNHCRGLFSFEREKREQIQSVYRPFRSYEGQLTQEIGEPDGRVGDLLLYETSPASALWAQNVWLNPKIIEFSSIGEASRRLRELGKIWIPYPCHFVRRVS